MLKITGLTALLVIASSANAALVSRDLYSAGDGLITYDTVSKLEWLDVAQTAGRSWNDVSGQFGADGDFAGWSYASRNQTIALYRQLGFNPDFDFRPNDPSFRSSYDTLIGLFGGEKTSAPGVYTFRALFGDPYSPTNIGYVPYIDMQVNDQSVGGYFHVETSEASANMLHFNSHLVRSEVPLPAALWLMGSGLAMLAGLKRRAK